MVKKTVCITVVLAAFIIAAGFYSSKLPGKVASAINQSKSNLLYQVYKPDSKGDNKNNAVSEIFHVRNVKPDMPLSEIIQGKGISDKDNYSISIDLKTRTLSFRYKDEILKQYVISAGVKTDSGDKQKEGDYRTPRGEFFICSKQAYSPSKKYLGSRWMLLSYPNVEAAERGLKNKMISKDTYKQIRDCILKKKTPPQNTPLGSAIGIHGGAEPNYPKDWTAGCTGLYDEDVEEIYAYVKVGTRVVIR